MKNDRYTEPRDAQRNWDEQNKEQEVGVMQVYCDYLVVANHPDVYYLMVKQGENVDAEVVIQGVKHTVEIQKGSPGYFRHYHDIRIDVMSYYYHDRLISLGHSPCHIEPESMEKFFNDIVKTHLEHEYKLGKIFYSEADIFLYHVPAPCNYLYIGEMQRLKEMRSKFLLGRGVRKNQLDRKNEKYDGCFSPVSWTSPVLWEYGKWIDLETLTEMTISSCMDITSEDEESIMEKKESSVPLIS